MDQDAKMAAMDEAAVVADAELRQMDQRITVPIARWWLSHFGKAGHKRLGRALVALAKEMRGVKDEQLATQEEQDWVRSINPESEDSSS